jgi:NTE family protein
MLVGLLEAGITADLLVGVSVGALHAAALAADPTLARARALAAMWEGLRSRDVFGSAHRTPVVNMLRHADHIYDDAALRRLVRRWVPGGGDLADLAVPVDIATTDLDAGCTTWWSAGPCEEVLVASASLPGLLPPVSLRGSRHVDGGVLVPVPVQRALDHGVADVWVLDVSGGAHAPGWDHSGGPLTAAQVLLRSFAVARYAGLPADWGTLARVGQRVHMVQVPAVRGVDLRDFSQGPRLLAAGWAAARSALTGARAAA